MFTSGSRASLENTDRFRSGWTYSSSPQDCRDQALAITDSHLGFRTRALVLGVSNQPVQAGGGGGRGGQDQDGRSLQQGINHDYFRGKWGTTCNRSR